MKPRRQRMLAVGLIVAGIAIALALILRALDSNIMLFLSPSEVVAGEAPAERPFRLGGHVVTGSFQRAEGSLTSTFLVTDNQETVMVIEFVPFLYSLQAANYPAKPVEGKIAFVIRS